MAILRQSLLSEIQVSLQPSFKYADPVGNHFVQITDDRLCRGQAGERLTCYAPMNSAAMKFVEKKA